MNISLRNFILIATCLLAAQAMHAMIPNPQIIYINPNEAAIDRQEIADILNTPGDSYWQKVINWSNIHLSRSLPEDAVVFRQTVQAADLDLTYIRQLRAQGAALLARYRAAIDRLRLDRDYDYRKFLTYIYHTINDSILDLYEAERNLRRLAAQAP